MLYEDGEFLLAMGYALFAEPRTSLLIISLRLVSRQSLWCRVPPIFAFSTKDLLELHKNRTKIALLKARKGTLFRASLSWLASVCGWLGTREGSRTLRLRPPMFSVM
ncbi:hypothetical protein Hanom_Chr03g00184461 [Helianthus anomalus]